MTIDLGERTMPLEPYQYHPIGSRPSTPSPTICQGRHSRGNSNASVWSTPNSSDTCATSPNVSPAWATGSRLLPKITTYDTTAISAYQRSTTCPPEDLYIHPSSTTANAYADAWHQPDQQFPEAFSPFQGRACPGLNYGHGRSISTSALEEAIYRRHAYPYRTLPLYVTSHMEQHAQIVAPHISDHITLPYQPQQPVQIARDLTPELVFDDPNEPTNTLLSYLTEANPKVDLVPSNGQISGDSHTAKHCWWDVRQVRIWEDFDLSTVMELPDFSNLLNINIKAAALPAPFLSSSALRPDSLDTLHDTYYRYYASKVNAALKVSQGDKSRGCLQQKRTARDGPQFICNYVNENSTILNSGRGRVVGLVKTYEQWNSDMRHGSAPKQVQFLRALAQLQWMMREQDCRYGFLMTELELICVRMGTTPCGAAPVFGFLELSRTIAISNTSNGLTACMALWYLHMLTSNVPLKGQHTWNVAVGAPAEKTRSKVLRDANGAEIERDGWIATIKGPTQAETRKATRLRGWIWPRDAYNPKREGGQNVANNRKKVVVRA